MTVFIGAVIVVGSVVIFEFFSNPTFYHRCVCCAKDFLAPARRPFDLPMEKRKQKILGMVGNAVLILVLSITVAISLAVEPEGNTVLYGHPNQHGFPMEMLVDVGNVSGDCTQCHQQLNLLGFRKDHKKAIDSNGRYELRECGWCHEADTG